MSIAAKELLSAYLGVEIKHGTLHDEIGIEKDALPTRTNVEAAFNNLAKPPCAK